MPLIKKIRAIDAKRLVLAKYPAAKIIKKRGETLPLKVMTGETILGAGYTTDRAWISAAVKIRQEAESE